MAEDMKSWDSLTVAAHRRTWRFFVETYLKKIEEQRALLAEAETEWQACVDELKRREPS